MKRCDDWAWLRDAGVCAVGLLIGVAGGCATGPNTGTGKHAKPVVLEYPARDLSPLSKTLCLDGETLEPMSAETLIERARSADVVLIGEYHGQAEGLAASAALWQAVVQQSESEGMSDAVLALEFIERDQQILLDDWLAAEEAMEPEAFSFKHGPMLLEAKRAGRPVIAANAPRRYVRMARTKGYEHLQAMTDTQQATFVIPGTGDVPKPTGAYQDKFFELFGGADGHGGGMSQEKIESYWRSQIMWDVTMADSLVRSLSDGARTVVLVVGRFHVAYDGGIPQALRAMQPKAEVFSVVMAKGEEIAELRKSARESDKESGGAPIADAVWVLQD
ncbi:MAG: ChaN family lipoprotein [Planctomycetota bacterium]